MAAILSRPQCVNKGGTSPLKAPPKKHGIIGIDQHSGTVN